MFSIVLLCCALRYMCTLYKRDDEEVQPNNVNEVKLCLFRLFCFNFSHLRFVHIYKTILRCTHVLHSLNSMHVSVSVHSKRLTRDDCNRCFNEIKKNEVATKQKKTLNAAGVMMELCLLCQR